MEIGILRYGVRQTEFFVIWGHFFPFYSTDDPENQNFEKMEKTSGDIIILYPRATNRIFFHFGSFFAVLLP